MRDQRAHSKFMWRVKWIVELHKKFSKGVRDLTATLLWQLEVLKDIYHIISLIIFSGIVIDFQKSLMYESQYRLVWLSLLVWFLLKTAGYSELSLTNSWPPVTDAPKTFTAGGGRGEGGILVSLQESQNLPVSSYSGTLIAKDKELNSKLGLHSVKGSHCKIYDSKIFWKWRGPILCVQNSLFENIPKSFICL